VRLLLLCLAVAGGAAVSVHGLRWWRVFRSVAGYRGYWARRAQRPGQLRYVALGDSLAQGVGASRPERGYVGVLAARLEADTGATVQVVNLSITGVRLADLLDGQLAALATQQRPDLVTVAIGANDAGRTDPERFRADFDRLCATLPDGALVADVPDFQGGSRRAAAATLSAVAREVLAMHPRLVPVALEAATSHMGWRDYSGDLFHPSDAGHRRYAAPFIHALGSR
jgi:acyl-CoA thioesterase-1